MGGRSNERYVYAGYFALGPIYEFLHDLKVDPDQFENFVDDPDYKDVLVRLRNRTNALKEQFEAARDDHR